MNEASEQPGVTLQIVPKLLHTMRLVSDGSWQSHVSTCDMNTDSDVTPLAWRKSSYSGGTGGNCVEELAWSAAGRPARLAATR